jgi:hypothetical protein
MNIRVKALKNEGPVIRLRAEVIGIVASLRRAYLDELPGDAESPELSGRGSFPLSVTSFW